MKSYLTCFCSLMIAHLCAQTVAPSTADGSGAEGHHTTVLQGSLLERTQRPTEKGPSLIDLSADEIMAQCRLMFPQEKVGLSGELTVRRQRGVIDSRRPYRITLDWAGEVPTAECTLYRDRLGGEQLQRAILTRVDGRATIRLFDDQNIESTVPPRFNSRIGETDITWMDLSLDYLWWPNAERRPELDERILSRQCLVIDMTPPTPIPGCKVVRLWIDRSMGYMLQAEHIGPLGKPIRRMWVQMVKKMQGRWMIRDLEIETVGLERRTRLFVEALELPDNKSGDVDLEDFISITTESTDTSK